MIAVLALLLTVLVAAVATAVDVAHDRQTRRVRAELAARHGWTMP